MSGGVVSGGSKETIVALIETPNSEWLEVNAESRDTAIAEGKAIKVIPIDPQERPPRRLHRRKPVDTDAEALVNSRRLAAAPPLCMSCLRAMTLIERMKATVEACKAACEAIMEELPITSSARMQAQERYQSAVSTAQFAIGDSQYVIRNLACNKGCIPVLGKQTLSHSADL